MGIIQNIFGKYNWNKREIIQEPDENIEDDNPYNFNISKSDAFYIANQNENLKTDYYRRRKGNITYIGFNDKSIKLVSLNNKKLYHEEKFCIKKRRIQSTFSKTFKDNLI